MELLVLLIFTFIVSLCLGIVLAILGFIAVYFIWRYRTSIRYYWEIASDYFGATATLIRLVFGIFPNINQNRAKIPQNAPPPPKNQIMPPASIPKTKTAPPRPPQPQFPPSSHPNLQINSPAASSASQPPQSNAGLMQGIRNSHGSQIGNDLGNATNNSVASDSGGNGSCPHESGTLNPGAGPHGTPPTNSPQITPPSSISANSSTASTSYHSIPDNPANSTQLSDANNAAPMPP